MDIAVDDLESVAEVSRRVDGLPLAIEVAAPRTRSMGLPELLGRLEHGIDVLDRPRFGARADAGAVPSSVITHPSARRGDAQPARLIASRFCDHFLQGTTPPNREGIAWPSMMERGRNGPPEFRPSRR